MAEENLNQQAPGAGDSGEGGGSDAEKPKPFLEVKDGEGNVQKSFADAEAVARSLRESQGEMTRAQQEAADLRRQLEQQETLKDLAQGVKALAEPVGQSEQERLVAFEREVERLEEGGTKAMAQAMLDTAYETERRAEEKLKQQLEAQQAQFETQLNGIRSEMSDFRPDFVQNAKEIRDIEEEFGVDRDKAIAIHSKFAPKTEHPDADAPPGTTGGSSRVSSPEPQTYMTEEDHQMYADMGYTDEEIVAANERGMARRKKLAEAGER